jgi:hypothetical protein
VLSVLSATNNLLRKTPCSGCRFLVDVLKLLICIALLLVSVVFFNCSCSYTEYFVDVECNLRRLRL